MVSKKNFQLNSRIMPQQRPGVRTSIAPYKKPYKAPIQLFSASQIPDDPGYVDFNNPNLPPISNTTSITNTSSSTGTGTPNSPPSQSASKVQQSQPQNQQQHQQQQQVKKKSNNKSKQKNKQHQNHGVRGGGGDGGGTGNGNGMNGTNNTNWSKKMSNMMNGGGGGIGLRGCNNGMQRGYDGRCDPVRPLRGRGGRMLPGMPRGGPMQSIVPPPLHGFQPPPMIPPMGAPIGRGPMPPIPPMAKGPGPLPPPIPPRAFMHRNGHKMPSIPPPMPPMLMPPRLPRNAIPPAVVPFNGSSGKIKKPNPKLIKKVIKSKSSIKTLKNLVNQYPLDKPWVTNDLKAEYDKKIDIENRLKGNKNDELFAQFKAQRDKFVSLYELAREEYLKKEAAAVKAKDGGKKDNETKNNTADLIKGNENQNVVVVEEKPNP